MNSWTSPQTGLFQVKFIFDNVVFRETSFRMFREGEGRELVRLLREAEKEATDREATAQQEAINCNSKLELRNKLKVLYLVY